MAKRFIETGIFRKRLLRGLDAPSKALWIYYITECDHAGIWDTANLDIDSILLGHEYTKESVMDALGDRVIPVDGKLFMPDFIRYQYGEHLNPKNRVHASVIKRLERLQIDPKTLAPCKPLVSPLLGVKDKDKDKVMDKDKAQDTYATITGHLADYARKIDQLAEAWAGDKADWSVYQCQQLLYEKQQTLANLAPEDWRVLRWHYIEASKSDKVKVSYDRQAFLRKLSPNLARAKADWNNAGKPDLARLTKAAA